MPGWQQTLSELENDDSTRFDRQRARHLSSMSAYTGRNVLVYYSGWLHRGAAAMDGFSLSDADKAGFMACAHGVRRDRGLDLLLHTPGGDLGAAESVIDYLHSLYGGNIRAFVPQLAMSSGSLIALSCREIVMGRHSSLGPVDPQIGGMPAQGVVEEFDRALRDISSNPALSDPWMAVLGKYWPGLLTACRHATTWADELLRNYLSECMFADSEPFERSRKIERVTNLFGKQATSLNHARHINPDRARDAGLKIVALEDDQTLQDLVLSLHHGLIQTLSTGEATKIIANDLGTTFVPGVRLRKSASADTVLSAIAE